MTKPSLLCEAFEQRYLTLKTMEWSWKFSAFIFFMSSEKHVVDRLQEGFSNLP